MKKGPPNEFSFVSNAQSSDFILRKVHNMSLNLASHHAFTLSLKRLTFGGNETTLVYQTLFGRHFTI